MGHTKIPNELMDTLMNKALNETEKAILLLVARQTYGYHKDSDKISLTQFERKLGYARTTIVRALDRLVKAKILVKMVLLPSKGKYGKACNEWKIDLSALPDGLVSMAQLVSVEVKNLVALRLHTKEIYTKEREYKKNVHQTRSEWCTQCSTYHESPACQNWQQSFERDLEARRKAGII